MAELIIGYASRIF
jgi:hypothetical protein